MCVCVCVCVCGGGKGVYKRFESLMASFFVIALFCNFIKSEFMNLQKLKGLSGAVPESWRQ